MFGVLPEQIAPDQLLAAGGHLQGRVLLELLPRLVASLPQDQAKGIAVGVNLRLVEDPQGRLWLKGQLHLDLVLVCERCREPLDWPISTEVGMYLVRSDQAPQELGDDVDYVVIGENLALHDLVEDEMILALPLVAKHPAGTECGERSRLGPLAESGVRDNPFAILKTLKN